MCAGREGLKITMQDFTHHAIIAVEKHTLPSGKTTVTGQ